MNLLIYYVTHTFINSIKKIFRTWVAVFIIGMIVFGMIMGFIGGAVSNYIGDKTTPDTQQEEQIEEEEHKVMSPEERAQVMEILSLVVSGITLAIILFNIYTSNQNGASIFTMPDINLLFPAPKKPQSVLLFKVVLQMGLIIVGSVYLLFQLPNLVLNLGLALPTAVSILFIWIIIISVGKLFSILTYTVTATHLKLRKFIRPFVIAVLLVIVCVYGLTFVISGQSLYQTAKMLFASKGFGFVPIWGWITALTGHCLHSRWGLALVFLILNILGILLLVYGIWNMKADFYEDALTNATLMSEKLEAAKAGMTAKKRSKKLKIETNFDGKDIFGSGPNVFFRKTVYNRNRFAKLGLFSSTSITYLLFFGLMGVLDSEVIHSNTLMLTGVLMALFVFFRSYGNPLASECEANFIYLVPESPYQKVLYSIAGGSYECLMDLLPGIIVGTILIKVNPISALMWLVFLVSLDFIAASVSLLVEMLLPVFLNDMIKAMFKLMLKIPALLPSVLGIIMGSIFKQTDLGIWIAAIGNIVLGVIITLASASFLHSGKN